MKRTLVISDIHGCYDEFMEVLKQANYMPEEDRLIILGDMIDRGKKSKDVVEHILALKNEYDVEVVGGNHEELFLKWLSEPFDRQHLYLKNGGWKTIESYCKPHKVYGKKPSVKHVFYRHYRHHSSFFEELLDYIEDDTHIFVHAGVDLSLPNWKDTSKNVFREIRDEFIHQKNTTGKTVVFGHTPTEFLHEGNDVWFSDDQKICIDGGCSMGGVLHCLIIQNGQYDIVSVAKMTK